MTLAHHEQKTHVRDLMPIMEKIGFVGNQTGIVSWNVLGFVKDSRASSV